jgi:molybdopterin converting factor small subunit
MKAFSGSISVPALAATGSGVSAQYAHPSPSLNRITSDVRYRGKISSLNKNVNDQLVEQDQYVANGDEVSAPPPNLTFTYQSDPARTAENFA